MFSKPDKPAAGGRRVLAASFIAENAALEGDLESQGDVQLDGALTGDISAQNLTIGETGRVVGSIEAETVEVRGEVSGSIKAHSVRLHGAARVTGDITHEQLSIEAGARFQGRSIQRDSAPAIALIDAAE
jgi:cytoskeletal protein CcmA (bactofilin family)